MQIVEYMYSPIFRFEYLALVANIEDCTKMYLKNCHDKGKYMNIFGSRTLV